MLKKAALFLVWSSLTFITLIVSLYSLMEIKTTKAVEKIADVRLYQGSSSNSSSLTYASLPETTGEIKAVVKSEDARDEILNRYLRKRGSPLAPYSGVFVRESDRNGIDFRLPVAIAECESNLCQEGKYPFESYNCWGYGIHSQGTLKFESFEQGITKVIEGLKKFKDRGFLTSIEKLMTLYTPPSIELGGPWARCVTHFMDELK